MSSLYQYIEIFKIINLIITLSILLTSLILYKINKLLKYLYLVPIYLVELLFIVSDRNTNWIYYLVFFVTLKFIFIITNKKNKSLNIFMNILIGCIYLLILADIDYKNEIILMLEMIVNSMIIDIFIIDYIKSLEVNINRDKKQYIKNKKNIKIIKNKLKKQEALQNNYKNQIIDLNTKINGLIPNSENIIFILNMKKEYIYGNCKFKQILEKDNIDEKKLDFYKYLNGKFIKPHIITESIDGLKIKNNNKVKDNDGNIYKFDCMTDTLDGNNIIICILTDITESTLIKNKLKESEQRYKNLMDILNDGVIIHDKNSVKYINTKALEIFDIRNEEAQMYNIEKKMISKYRHKFIENKYLVESDVKDKVISKISTIDGKTIEVITTSIALNQTNMLLSIIIDISDLENTVCKLNQNKDIYKTLLQTIPEGIAIVDKNTKKYTYRNKNMIEILKDVGVDKLNVIINDCLQENNYNQFKKVSLSSNKKINIALINSFLEDKFIVVIRCIDDDYKKVKMKEQLEEIENKCKFKTEFLANMANDLKKPIRVIFESNKILHINKNRYNIGYLDNHIKLTNQNCYRLMRLLDNIKEISNIENGKYNIDIKKYDVVYLIKEITEKSKRYTDKKNISLKLECNIQHKILEIDKCKIEKSILNLLSNSIKFTEENGEIIVNVNYKNKKVYITINDNGIGIPKEKINVIFESFEQVDRTLSRGTEGSGIGLSLAKKLIELHKGKLEVKSEVNRGSEFTIILNDTINTDLSNNIEEGINFVDNENIDIEFSDIYFNNSY